MNPRLDINYEKLVHNTRILTKKAEQQGIVVAGVTKVFQGNPAVAQAYIDGGVQHLADSRISNLSKLTSLSVPKILLRIPMHSEIGDVVKYADISLNSELSTLKLLNEEAKIQAKIHGVIVMVDLGDLREGIFSDKEFNKTIMEIKELQFIDVKGIGVNLTCHGGVIPTEKNLSKLVAYGKRIEEILGHELEIYSGGNSSSVYLLDQKKLHPKINHLRLGEAFVLGTESAYGEKIPNTHQDIFQLVGEIVELKEKPSVPIGEIGMDAFGNTPSFEDRGIRKRAILAVGKQDFGSYDLFPVE